MPERVEFHPLPAEPDRVETPTAKNKREQEEREAATAKRKELQNETGWEEVDLDNKAA